MSEKSNVLFLERYRDCLREGGELLTVIDNTVLNGTKSQKYRDYILKHFVIRQVISLPFNTFFRAQANVQTSIIHLKKREQGEEQGAIFMAILNNIGHNDHQIFTPERDNVPRLIDSYRIWRETGKTTEELEPNADTSENLGCPFQAFVVPPDALNKRRLDAFYYAPDLQYTRRTLRSRDTLDLLGGRDFKIVPKIKASDEPSYRGRIFRYFDIGDVTMAGSIVNYEEDYFENLPTRGRLRIRANDVLFAKNNSSRGTCVVVPPEFDGHLSSTGFIAIRPKDEEEALLLWAILTSETFRKGNDIPS